MKKGSNALDATSGLIPAPVSETLMAMYSPTAVSSGRTLTQADPDDGRFVAKPYSLQHLADTMTRVVRADD